MTRPTYNLSLRDRNLIRFERHQRLENFHAQSLAKNGDIKFFEMEADMDDEFPYPFGKVGTRKISCLEISEKGRARMKEISETNMTEYDTYQAGCRVEHYAYLDEQILYTAEATYSAIMSGDRDRLFAFNQIISRDTERKVRARSIDPDTYELLVSDAEIQAMDLYDDDIVQLKYR